MPKKVQIAIPKPCHENWQDMTPTEKGRFCASCKKEVQDFTKLNDKTLLLLKKDKNICGRFLASQTNRDLVVPKEKSSLWVAAGAAVVSFIGLGNYEAVAQETHPTEQHATQKSEEADKIDEYSESRRITGIVTDTSNTVLPGVTVKNLSTKAQTQCDYDGIFTIIATKGDIIELTYIGKEMMKFTVTESNTYNFKLIDDKEESEVLIGSYIVMPRTFFGRIFHSIGNVFRRH